MDRKKEQKIGSLLDAFIKDNNLQQGLAEYRLKKAWEELLGKTVARTTRSLEIRNRTLLVHLHSSVLRNELTMIREDLIIRLNEAAGLEIIDDIIIK